MSRRCPRVMAISSGGGHWVEMLRLRPAFEGSEVHFVTVDRAYATEVPGERFHAVRDATRWNKFSLVVLACQVAWLLLRLRPDVVLTTGAAPGYFAVRLGKMLGRRTVWLDSIANVDELSMSGQMAGRWADLWLTQWEHLASPGGPECRGAVM